MHQLTTRQVAPEAPWRLRVLIVSMSVVVGGAVVWLAATERSLSWLIVVLPLPFLLVQLRLLARVLLFASIATVSLSVYQLPLPADLSLQLTRAVLLAAVVVVLLASRRGVQVLPRVSGAALALAIFLLFNIASYLLRGEGDAVSLSILVAIAFGLIYVLWIPRVILHRTQLRMVLWALISANLIILVFALYQYFAWFTGFQMEGYSFSVPFSSLFGAETMLRQTVPSRIGPIFRLTLPFSSSSHLGPCIAALMLVTLPFQVSTLVPKRLSRLLLLYHAVMFFLLLMTFSRGAWLGWFIGMLVILAAEKRLAKFVQTAMRIGIVILILGIIIAASRPELLSAVAERFDFSQTELSDQTHLEFGVYAIDMFSSSPILGAGFGSYYHSTGILHPHNTYLQILAEGGIVGLVFALAWLALVLHQGYKALRKSEPSSFEYTLAAGLLGAFASILANNLTQQSLYFNFSFLVAALIGAVYLLVETGERDRRIVEAKG